MKMYCTNGLSMIKSIQRRKNGTLEPNHVKKWYQQFQLRPVIRNNVNENQYDNYTLEKTKMKRPSIREIVNGIAEHYIYALEK